MASPECFARAVRANWAIDPMQTTRAEIPVSRQRKRSGWTDDLAGTVLGQMR